MVTQNTKPMLLSGSCRQHHRQRLIHNNSNSSSGSGSGCPNACKRSHKIWSISAFVLLPLVLLSTPAATAAFSIRSNTFLHQSAQQLSEAATMHTTKINTSSNKSTHKSFSSSSSLTKLNSVMSSSSSSSSSKVEPKKDMESLYWNRETAKPYEFSSDDTKRPIVQKAKILNLGILNDDANKALFDDTAADDDNVKVVATIDVNQPELNIMENEEFMNEIKAMEPNVVFVSHPKAREPLAKIIEQIPTIQWIHTRSAGIDFVTSPTLTSTKTNHIQMTNSKGCYSSTLAEYTMMACSYFAKDLPRLLRQKAGKNWEKYSVKEIRGTTMGIIGYGDIGRACAKLAKAYGMKTIALRRNVDSCQDDPYCDIAYDAKTKNSLHQLMKDSDYVLVSAPLTPETKGMVDAEALSYADEDTVLINVGRGPIIDEDAMIEVLKGGKIKGAALDVVSIEPLPKESMLWELDNVLLSPHNMDQTDTFQHEATDFFLKENLPRFLRGETLLNPVDKTAGY